MSAAPAYSAPMTAHRGGEPALPARMTPAALSLTLPATVLRLPYPPATRLVLAEIVSLHAANGGCCDASDAHFAARLTINKDTANVAVKLLVADGLVTKVVTRSPTGFYRTLTPNAAAIAAKAAGNPYPENTASPTRKFRVANAGTLPGISGLAYPEIPATPTRKNPLPLPGNSVSNIPVNLHQSSSIDSAAGKKIGEDFPQPEAFTVEAGPLPEPALPPTAEPDRPAAAPKEKVAGKRKGPARPARSTQPDVPFLESELATLAAFTAAFDGTDYALANLAYYHEKIAAWRQKGEVPRRKDWKATAKQFFLNDISSNSLVLAPGVHRAGDPAANSGACPGGYRSRRYDA